MENGQSLQHTMFRKPGSYVQKGKMTTSTHKSQFKMDQWAKSKSQTTELLKQEGVNMTLIWQGII